VITNRKYTQKKKKKKKQSHGRAAQNRATHLTPSTPLESYDDIAIPNIVDVDFRHRRGEYGSDESEGDVDDSIIGATMSTRVRGGGTGHPAAKRGTETLFAKYLTVEERDNLRRQVRATQKVGSPARSQGSR
jgi:hypothetical protein